MQAKDLKDLIEALKKNRVGGVSDGAVQSALQRLSPAERDKLGEILSSPEKMRSLLSSDAARELGKKLGLQEK